jgi:TolB protein
MPATSIRSVHLPPRRSVGVVVMLGLPAAFWLAQLAGVAATPAGSNGTIIFSMRPDGEITRQLYTMMPDGSLRQPVCQPQPGDNFDAQFSRDGKRIAFVSTRDGSDIFVMNADCTGLSNITNDTSTDNDPGWSPDSSRIVFTSRRTGDSEIWSMNPDGTGLVRLTNSPGTDSEPAYSPDGTGIAFVSHRAGYDAVWVMDADGANPRRLTNAPATGLAEFVRSPDWSPDGSLLAYQVGFVMPPLVRSFVQVISAEGSPVGSLDGMSSFREASSPVWSPDGTSVVFVGSPFDGSGLRISAINADGTSLRTLAGPPALYSDVSWRSDNPICEIELSQPSYTNDEVVTAQSVRLANPALVPAAVELKLFSAPPGGDPIAQINIGADGTIVLPAGFEQELGPQPLFTVTPAYPRGFSQIGCRLLNPVTGASRYADVNRFVVQ